MYKLPDGELNLKKPGAGEVHFRRAMAYEKHQVINWVREHFGNGWASECDVAFSNRPISCHIATENGAILGFACYDSTSRGMFGPLGVLESERGGGIGRGLLLASLHAMVAVGYAYAIIGGAGSMEFYQRVVNVMEIPDSTPGIYIDRLAE
ncbi:MAG TPA: GNAT family N-acetyltransferase [Nitrosospira sp.]